MENNTTEQLNLPLSTVSQPQYIDFPLKPLPEAEPYERGDLSDWEWRPKHLRFRYRDRLGMR